MAGLFMPPARPKTPKVPEQKPAYDAAGAAAMVNNKRRSSGGSYKDTIVGSGLKTSFGQ